MPVSYLGLKVMAFLTDRVIKRIGVQSTHRPPHIVLQLHALVREEHVQVVCLIPAVVVPVIVELVGDQGMAPEGVDRTNEKQQGFLLWMRRNGYRVIAKDLVQLPDGSKKANLDVEIAVDLMALVDYYDTAVLVSGDGDLAYAVDAVSYRGARIEVVSLRSMTSDSLINVADRYIDLDQIREDIQKTRKSNLTYDPFSPYHLTENRDPDES